MKSVIFAAIFFFASIILTTLFRHDYDLVIAILATILGFMLGKFSELQHDVKFLREAFARDWEQRQTEKSQGKNQPQPAEGIADHIQAGDVQTDKKTQGKTSETQPSMAESMNPVSSVSEASVTATEPVSKAATTIQPAQQEAAPEPVAAVSDVGAVKDASSSSSYQRKQDDSPDLTDKIGAYIKNYFTGGNLFVRIGILILFFGVSFLLKYVSDRGLFPIEYRLMGVAAGAIFLLVLGWRLRHKKAAYALLLQGAGIGILYLDIYAAFSLYHLLSPLPAFVLLFVVSMLSAALAVLQDSKSLAVLGFSGGFLAPVLASSGSNNHVGLFSYYAVLNLAIVVIAWFKSWRALNLLGFAFTFIIGTVWGVFSYTPEKFATTEPFLILFFLFYVLIAVFFALREPDSQQSLLSENAQKLQGYVDGTLLFGVPLAASALQYSMVKPFQYGVSLSAFAMGAFYLFLTWFLWKRMGERLKLLAEALLALGVIFTSMAIPFALSPTQTAAAWALEGVGLLWLGSRQNRLSVRVFGLLLQLGAGFFVFMQHDDSYHSKEAGSAFLNGSFISAMLIAVAGILSARLLFKSFKGRKLWEQSASPMLLTWGLLWLFGGFIEQISSYYGDKWLPSGILILAAIVSLGFNLVAQRLKPEWRHAWYAASCLLGVMLLVALLQFANHGGFFGIEGRYHPLELNGWIAWPLAFGAFYYLLKKLEVHQLLGSLHNWFHTLTLLLLVVLITLEGRYQLARYLAADSDWSMVWLVVPAMATLWLVIKAGFWPFAPYRHKQKEQQSAIQYPHYIGLVLAAVMMLWGFQALILRGNPEPLAWIPLLNPLDITLGFVFISLIKWWKSISLVPTDDTRQNALFNKRSAAISFGLLVFLWLNFTVFRIAHHWFGVSYSGYALYNSSLVQTAVSILWALSGVFLTVFASRKALRVLWIAGGALLILVALKLFVIDLSELGSLARIISFLVVGALLTSIGYFAPLPDKQKDAEVNRHEAKG